jgi:hypothetical protein
MKEEKKQRESVGMKGKYIIGILLLFLVVSLFLVKQKTYTLPKVVWTHWNTSPPPEPIQKIIARMRKMLPDWQVELLTTDGFLKTVHPSEVPPKFADLGVEHQADWIRLKVLKQYGGCWMDSGIFLNESINTLYNECVRNKADLLVFKINQTQTNPKYPIAENWFIMAPPNSIMVSLWLEEYERAISYGFPLYKKQIQQEGVDLQNLMKSEENVYLTQHGCYQKVIQQRMPPNVKVIYHTAEDSMFKIQAQICKWDVECIWEKLKEKELLRSVPYVKLRGLDRKKLDAHDLD